MAIRTALLIVGIATLAYGRSNKYTHYYWRDYTGEIPCDAVIGAFNDSGTTIYIGQGWAMYNEAFSLAPVPIVEGERVQKTVISGVPVDVVPLKILCVTSPYPDKWIETNTSGLVAVAEKNQLIPGGIEFHTDPAYNGYNFNLTIGRAQVGGKPKIGKIVSYFGMSVLYLVDGDRIVEALNFEVLAANN
ncbi:unnamed protein product [Callosobruchus maculatus]|uniref:Uncharacterized protein n=1 Tax=Callosobruchus maculatus TaxID=64391 RepID=A0A653CJI7_CALMS|nr:unnamed protein product [Callosobruchus maculatus]